MIVCVLIVFDLFWVKNFFMIFFLYFWLILWLIVLEINWGFSFVVFFINRLNSFLFIWLLYWFNCIEIMDILNVNYSCSDFLFVIFLLYWKKFGEMCVKNFFRLFGVDFCVCLSVNLGVCDWFCVIILGS